MLSRKEFLALVLPPLEEGETYCSWGNNTKKEIKQTFVKSVDELSQEADKLLGASFNSFFGLAKYGIVENGRHASNAVSLKSFFVDVDCYLVLVQRNRHIQHFGLAQSQIGHR